MDWQGKSIRTDYVDVIREKQQLIENANINTASTKTEPPTDFVLQN
jgi:hypothetical protein